MNDPRRLIESEASAFETRLLRAGAQDDISEASRRAVLSGLGLSSVVSPGALGAAARRAARGSGLGRAAARWAGGAVLSVVALGVGITLWSKPTKNVVFSPNVGVVAPSDTTEPAAVDAQAPALEATPKEDVAPPPDSSKVALLRSHSARALNNDKSDSLADELAAIELARSALVRSNAAQCLHLLDDYARRFPKRRLEAEATVLRIEALSVDGERSGALRLGRAFLSKQPQGPYARRVRSLIGESRGTGVSEP